MDATQELAPEPTLREVWDTFTKHQQEAVYLLVDMKMKDWPIRQRLRELKNQLTNQQHVALDLIIRAAPSEVL